MDMYNNEEMEYELGPKTECYVWWPIDWLRKLGKSWGAAVFGESALNVNYNWNWDQASLAIVLSMLRTGSNRQTALFVL